MIIMKEDHSHLMLLPSELLKSRKQKLHLVVSLPTIPWKTLNPNCNSQARPSMTGFQVISSTLPVSLGRISEYGHL